MEIILSTDGQGLQRHGIIQQQNFCIYNFFPIKGSLTGSRQAFYYYSINKWVPSHNGHQKVVLALGVASGQYNLPWAIMTILGHITSPL
jgi:hypothetical protein